MWFFYLFILYISHQLQQCVSIFSQRNSQIHLFEHGFPSRKPMPVTTDAWKINILVGTDYIEIDNFTLQTIKTHDIGPPGEILSFTSIPNSHETAIFYLMNDEKLCHIEKNSEGFVRKIDFTNSIIQKKDAVDYFGSVASIFLKKTQKITTDSFIHIIKSVEKFQDRSKVTMVVHSTNKKNSNGVVMENAYMSSEAAESPMFIAKSNMYIYLLFTDQCPDCQHYSKSSDMSKLTSEIDTVPFPSVPRLSIVCPTNDDRKFIYQERRIPLFCFDPNTNLPLDERFFNIIVDAKITTSENRLINIIMLVKNKKSYGVCYHEWSGDLAGDKFYNLPEICLKDDGSRLNVTYLPMVKHQNCQEYKHVNKFLKHDEENTLKCKRLELQKFTLSKLSFPRSQGEVNQFHIQLRQRISSSDYILAEVFVVDEFNNLRMYGINNFDKDVVDSTCLDAIIPLVSREANKPSPPYSVRAIVWNEFSSHLVVFATNFRQLIAYDRLCGLFLMNSCEQSVFCSGRINYCKRSRSLINQANLVDTCISPEGWNTKENTNSLQTVDPYPCDYNGNGCVVVTSAKLRKNPYACPKQFCMCQREMCKSPKCNMFLPGKVVKLWCTPTSYAQTMNFITNEFIEPNTAPMMMLGFFTTLAALFAFTLFVFCFCGETADGLGLLRYERKNKKGTNLKHENGKSRITDITSNSRSSNIRSALSRAKSSKVESRIGSRASRT